MQFAIKHVKTSRFCRDLTLQAGPFADSCAAARNACYEKSMELVGSSLDPLEKVPLFESVPCNICRHCASEARRAFDARRRDVWNMLPLIFGLPPWEKLTNEQ